MTETMQRSRARAEAGAADWRSKVARPGLVGRGLLYSVLGLLAIDVATGDTSTDASAQGAVERVARAPYGQFLLIVLTVTLVALVAWKVLQVVSGDPAEGSDTSDRLKYAAKGAVYLGAAVSAVSILAANWGEDLGASSGGGAGGGSGESGEEQAAAVVMDWPAGRWIVALVGLGLIAFGAYELVKHTIGAEFMGRLSVDPSMRAPVEAAGRVGYGAQAAVAAGVGVFFVIAGVTHDDDEAEGLSGLLQELAGNGWGQVLLWLIAVGLFLYGLFSLAEARFRRTT